MIPAYRIEADQTDITPLLQRYLAGLTLTDQSDTQADEISLDVADPHGEVALPRRGTVLSVAIGWKDALTHKGRFIVDEVSESGPPTKFAIRARSADFRGTLKVRRDASFDNKKLGDILGSLAARHKLIPAIEPGLATIALPHIDQTNESDLHFLTRLGQDFDAIATIKDGRLLFMPTDFEKTISGLDPGPVHVRRDQADTHHFTLTDRDATITGVRARWRSLTAGETRHATAGTGPDWFTFKRDFPNAVIAWHAARAQWQRTQRGKATLSLKLAKGNPDILAGRPLALSGWREEITRTRWLVSCVTHRLDDNGYLTSLEAVDIASNADQKQ